MKKLKITKTKLREDIILLEFETRRELCSTFLRFQEFYESPYIKHETAYALFALDKTYRKKVLTILSRFDNERAKKELKKHGRYAESVLDDEVHAYALINYLKKIKGISEELAQELEPVFKEYKAENFKY